ncbi:hypothetical protein ACGFU4_36250 [Streptomyces sp. NPDC048511]|uniref:hypothetical protein n=1 Tax=Streptomyces sp. NPDC048511 TaxID=3365562 RepID=UPI0037227C1F
MPDLVEVPAELAEEIGYEDLNPWPWFADRDTELWAETPYTHEGETVLAPFAIDMRPATKSSVEAAFGPLAPAPHCPICGSTLFWDGEACGMRTVSTSHPQG